MLSRMTLSRMTLSRMTQSRLTQLTAAIVLGCLASFSQAQEPAESAPFNNVYEQERSEQLLQTGQLQMREGEFEAAEITFLDALQIAKVNYGLKAPQQREALRYVIEAQLALGKWEQADRQLGYFEWLNDEIYLRDFYDYLYGTQLLSDLLYRASANADNANSTRYLLAAKNLSWRAVTGIEATLGEESVELVPWLYNIVMAHYYQVSLLKRPAMFSAMVETEGDEEYRGWLMHKGESLRISYRIGKDLLERIHEIYLAAEESAPESAALTLIYRADWELLFGHEADALALYGDAYQQLLDKGIAPSQADSVFSKPRALPVPTIAASLSQYDSEPEGPIQFNAWTPNYPAAALPKAELAINPDGSETFMALLSFNLNPLLPGRLMENKRSIKLGFSLRDLEVISTSPDNDMLRERARYEVSLLQLRPVLQNGLPVTQDAVQLEYRFAPQYEGISLSEN